MFNKKINDLKVNKEWVLFLDRDGVINKKIENDYVKKWNEFKFIDRSLEAISLLSVIFDKIFIVTNQRGVGKKLMTQKDLEEIHKKMILKIEQYSGKINKVYSCPEVFDEAECRKPNIGMAKLAKKDFPNINFNKAVMVGDSVSDMKFGKKLKMTSVFINEKQNETEGGDFTLKSLYELACLLNEKN